MRVLYSLYRCILELFASSDVFVLRRDMSTFALLFCIRNITSNRVLQVRHAGKPPAPHSAVAYASAARRQVKYALVRGGPVRSPPECRASPSAQTMSRGAEGRSSSSTRTACVVRASTYKYLRSTKPTACQSLHFTSLQSLTHSIFVVRSRRAVQFVSWPLCSACLLILQVSWLVLIHYLSSICILTLSFTLHVLIDRYPFF